MTIKTEERKLHVIAREIAADWKNMNFAAKPYLNAMLQLNSMDVLYGVDAGTSVVAYFLSNAGMWRGEVARRVKKELRSMLKVRDLLK